MNILYLVLIVFSSVAITVDLILRFTLKIKRFGLEAEFLCFKGKTIPVEDFIPHTLTMLEIFVFSFSVSGQLYFSVILTGHIASVVLALCTALSVNFIIAHFVIPTYNRARKNVVIALKPDDKAICTERISGDGYGAIAVEKNGKTFTFPAVSANDTDIEEGTEVTVIVVEDGVYVVQPESEIHNVTNEDTVERNDEKREFTINEN